MPPSPYRGIAGVEQRRKRRAMFGDRDLMIPLGVFWFVSAFRVASALAERETFGTSATLALVATLIVPIALGRRLLDRDHRH